MYSKAISGAEPPTIFEGVLARDMAIGSPVDLGPAGNHWPSYGNIHEKGQIIC